jgi:hypothetical protein
MCAIDWQFLLGVVAGFFIMGVFLSIMYLKSMKSLQNTCINSLEQIRRHTHMAIEDLADSFLEMMQNQDKYKK